MKRFRVATVLLVGVLGLGSVLGDARGGEATDKLALARKFMTDFQEWDTAAGLLNEFLRERPEDPAAGEALVLLGYAHEKQDQYDRAFDCYVRALERRPASALTVRQDALQGAAYAAYRLARYGEAGDFYGRFAAAFPEHDKAADAWLWQAESRYQAALALRAAGDTDEAPATMAAFRSAEEGFVAFLERHPGSKQSASALASAGFAAFDGRDYQRAIRHFRRFLADYGDDARAADCCFHLAEALYRLDDFAAARTEYAKGFAPPFDRDAARAATSEAGAAWCDYRLGDPLAAAAGFASAARRAPDPVQARVHRRDAALAYREGGDFDGAAREFAALVRDDPEGAVGASALARLGALTLDAARQIPATSPDRSGRLREAADLLRRAADHPAAVPADAADARLALGEALLDAGDAAGAADAFGAFVAGASGERRHAWALYHLALARREQSLAAARAGDGAGGRRYLEQAKESLRGVFAREDEKLRLQAAYALADYLNALGEADAARKVYAWVADEGPSWAARWRDADGKTDPELAASAGRLALDSRFRLGESLYAAKDAAGAGDCYRRVVEGWPDSEHAGMGLLRLGEIAEAAGDATVALDRYDQAVAQGRSAVASGHARLRLGALLLARAQALSADAPAASDEARRRAALLARALAALDPLVAPPPSGGEAARPWYYRAEILYALDRKAEALDDYRRAQAADTDGRLADALLFGLAWVKRDQGDVAGALADFLRLRTEYPQSRHAPEALLAVGLMRREGGDDSGASDAFLQLTREYPDHVLAPRALAEAGFALATAGCDDAAAKCFADFAQRYPDHAEAPRVLYRWSWSLSAPAAAAREAVVRLEREIAALSGGTSGATDRTRPLTAERDAARARAREADERAAQPLQTLLERFPDDALVVAAALRLGEIAYDRADYAVALDAYVRATALAERHASDLRDKARYRLAWCRWRLADESLRAADALTDVQARATARRAGDEKLRVAGAAFEEVVRNHPDSVLAAESLFRAAEARRLLARTPEENGAAVRMYDEAIRLEAGRREGGAAPATFVAGALYGSGLCLLAQGEARGARERFDRFLAADPESPVAPDAWWGRGRASLDLDATADAREAFGRAIESGGDGEAAAKARYGLGLAAMKERDWEKARIEFIAAETYSPQWPEWAARAMLQSSRAALEAGETEKARRNLERLLERYPDQDAAGEAAELLRGARLSANLIDGTL